MLEGRTDRLPALVIFDCDGVLVDSEIIASRIFADCLGEVGIVLTIEEAAAFGVGKSAVTLAAAVEKEFGRPLPAGFIEGMRARIITAFTRELKPINGVARLLTALDLPRCVASNSHIDRVRHALKTTGLLRYLDPNIYTAAMVERGKPAPDLFLFAAAQHGVAPAQCLVVEDSLSGVVAALAAEMTVVGFVGGSHCRAGHSGAMLEAGCTQVFDRMERLAEFLIVRIHTRSDHQGRSK
jgi:HAD superfamily hydrolase (TIGR01509 family)